MQNVFLYVAGKGWQSFDLTTDEGKSALKERDICLGYGARIGNEASIGDGVKARTLFFSGTRHSVMYWGEDCVQIGCKRMSLAEWLVQYKEVGKAEGYTDSEIEEYGQYLEIIKSFHASILAL